MKQVGKRLRGAALLTGMLWAGLLGTAPGLARGAEESTVPSAPPEAEPEALEVRSLDASRLEAQRGEGLTATGKADSGLQRDLAVILWDEVARERGRKGAIGLVPAATTLTINGKMY